MEGFNSLSRELIQNISYYNNYLIDHKKENLDYKNIIRQKISELQWRSLELQNFLHDKDSLNTIKIYKKSLETLRYNIEIAKKIDDIDNINKAVASYTISSMNISKILAQRSKLSEKDVQ